MAYTKYNLYDLSSKSGDIENIASRINKILNNFTTIKSSIDADILYRDNIHSELNNLQGSTKELVDNTYGINKVLQNAIDEYSSCEKQLNNLLNTLSDTSGKDKNPFADNNDAVASNPNKKWDKELFKKYNSSITHLVDICNKNNSCTNIKKDSKYTNDNIECFKDSSTVSIEETIEREAILNTRKRIDEILLEYKSNLKSMWDRPGISHTLLEGSYGQIYYNILVNQREGLRCLELTLDMADFIYAGATSYGTALEATGGNIYFAVPLSFVIYAASTNENMPGEKPSNIDDAFGWTDARKKGIYATTRKLEYILKSDYRYFMDLYGYKKVMIKELEYIKKQIINDDYEIYENDKDNKHYKDIQIKYLDKLINMNKNEKIYKKKLENDLKIIEQYVESGRL
ncbi:hypothetical protein [Vallitalea guaymasensis]|uniref:LXG domain-containing protein n=1 Tax=Vallitalea guaymasensis TaxID=1185412 RepID=A0A8J8SBI2_9FIRM|nr:hypothetical protein [Vallitalea guaymasensis]QUH28808.1 hypothetical protein HYG85_07730 [Vallitalea guaymasensis]